MNIPHRYSIYGFGELINDPIRTPAYLRALEQTVTPDSVVLDIGTGTGIFALHAAHLGARHVFAIEPNDAIILAQQMAFDNNLAGRITFLQTMSTEVDLVERADIIVADLHGILPFWEHHIETIVDARERLLKKGGTLIPCEDKVYAAPVTVPESYARWYDTPWLHSPYGLDMSRARDLLVNDWHRVSLRADALLGESHLVAVLDYETITNPDLKVRQSWPVNTTGILHGIALWFDCELLPGIGVSNQPGEREVIYGQHFLPLSSPLAVEKGCTIDVLLEARLVSEEYVWRWETQVVNASGARTPKQRQSTLWSKPRALRKANWGTDS